ncbi:carboxymuconolactone decarboxylase family protein [Conexibacter woesei]|uniref:carboxymuconolactone decarboxylase family protein n=1 Tax=Conexibacter woesei TaxID=191495 RepID=UPI0009DC49F3|nr:carboxymuconolactone decarboxylase family protein [Conexibacter woesei]
MSGSRVAPATGLQARMARMVATRMIGGEGAEMAAIYANHPRLARAFTFYDRAVSRRSRTVPEKLMKLAELKAATVVGCEFCIDIGSALARESGLTDAQLLALHDPEPSGLFSADELLVIAYARAMTLTPPTVDDTAVQQLTARFGTKGLFELTYLIAWENVRARMNSALEIPVGGFSEGKVCALPAASAAPARSEAVA